MKWILLIAASLFLVAGVAVYFWSVLKYPTTSNEWKIRLHERWPDTFRW